MAPGTDEVVVLRGEGAGGFAPAVWLPSGGSQPVAVVIAQLVGEVAPDSAVGHRDGIVTFFWGNADGTFTFRPASTVSGLGVVTALAVADMTGDGEATWS